MTHYVWLVTLIFGHYILLSKCVGNAGKYLGKKNQTFVEAMDYCHNHNLTVLLPGDPLTFETYNESSSVWLNIRKRTYTDLTWVDNSSLGTGIIPTVNQGRTEECAFLVAKKDYIAVDECHVSNYGYICQVNGTCNKISHKSLSFGYMRSCFNLHFEPVPWSEAFVNCKRKGSNLAMMKTKKAINDISLRIKKVHMESVYYWIGLRRSQWNIWDKPDSDVSVSNWLPDEPRYGYDCAVITPKSWWKSVHCDSRHTTVCTKGTNNNLQSTYLSGVTPTLVVTSDSSQEPVSKVEIKVNFVIVGVILAVLVGSILVITVTCLYISKRRSEGREEDPETMDLLVRSKDEQTKDREEDPQSMELLERSKDQQTKDQPSMHTDRTTYSHQAVWYSCTCSDGKGVRGLRLVPAYTLKQEGIKYRFCLYILDTDYIERDFHKIADIVLCDKGVALMSNCNQDSLKASLNMDEKWKVISEQSRKIHDCVGCHNKEDPELIAEYELEGYNNNKEIRFSVTFSKDKGVFSVDTREETTHFTIRNPIICGTFRRSVLVFNLFKCDHTECKTRPARRLTLQPMCFLHVADVDKNLYWLRIYILDWHGIMDHYVKELQLIEQEANYYLGEVLQLPNVAYLPPTAKLIIKLKDADNQLVQFDDSENESSLVRNNEQDVQKLSFPGMEERRYEVELYNILNCHPRKHCIEPVVFVINKDKLKDNHLRTHFTITVDSTTGDTSKSNEDITSEISKDVITTDFVMDIKDLKLLQHNPLCLYSCGHSNSTPRRLSLMPAWSFYRDQNHYILKIYLVDVVYNWDYAQTLKALSTGKIVTYTGHRVQLPYYHSLTEKDIIQVTVKTDNTGWTVHGENYIKVSLDKVHGCHFDNERKTPHCCTFRLTTNQKNVACPITFSVIRKDTVSLPLKQQGMNFDLDSKTASEHTSTKFNVYLETED